MMRKLYSPKGSPEQALASIDHQAETGHLVEALRNPMYMSRKLSEA
jgi:hypothetical protein